MMRCILSAGLLAALLFGWAQPAFAHSPFSGEAQEQLTAILTAIVLALFWGVYLRGAWLRPPGLARWVTFNLTAVLAVLALLGPLDDWAKASTAAHMTQHMMLMVVIAPLWVLCRPLAQIVAGGGRPAAAFWMPMLRLSSRPMWAAYLHGFMIWFWHLPYFYMLAVENPWWHAIEHACFLVSAGIFWWAILRFGKLGAGWALLALLLTLMHTGFLGAVLTFAQAPLYGEARDLEDQQLAGLIMWVLAAIPYMAASAWIGHRWFRQLDSGVRPVHGRPNSSLRPLRRGPSVPVEAQDEISLGRPLRDPFRRPG
jgi:putative membrane protein